MLRALDVRGSPIRVQQSITLDLPHDLATAHFKQLEVLELSAIREPLPPLLVYERAIHVGAHQHDLLTVNDAHDCCVSLHPPQIVLAPELMRSSRVTEPLVGEDRVVVRVRGVEIVPLIGLVGSKRYALGERVLHTPCDILRSSLRRRAARAESQNSDSEPTIGVHRFLR